MLPDSGLRQNTYQINYSIVAVIVNFREVEGHLISYFASLVVLTKNLCYAMFNIKERRLENVS